MSGPDGDAVDLNRLLASLAGRLRAAAGDGAALQFGFCSSLPPVRADPRRVEADLLRLVRSARRALPPDAPLRLFTDRTGMGESCDAGLVVEAGQARSTLRYPSAWAA